MSDNEEQHRRHTIAAAAALLLGIGVPFLGFATLLGDHPASEDDIASWVHVAMPFSFLAAGQPSVPVFLLLMAGNVIAWGAVAYWLTRGIQRFFSQS